MKRITGLLRGSPVFDAFTLMPVANMRDALERDYDAMSGMIFQAIPSLDEVLASVEQAEAAINA